MRCSSLGGSFPCLEWSRYIAPESLVVSYKCVEGLGQDIFGDPDVWCSRHCDMRPRGIAECANGFWHTIGLRWVELGGNPAYFARCSKAFVVRTIVFWLSSNCAVCGCTATAYACCTISFTIGCATRAIDVSANLPDATRILQLRSLT